MSKFCPGCNQDLALEAFYVDRSRGDGKTSYCKKCQDKRHSKWVKANPDKDYANMKKSEKPHQKKACSRTLA